MAHHDPPRLFLVDGYALIYRAFYALIGRPLRTSRGENTSAAWGVANFLLRLQATYRPDYLVWVHDAGDSGRTERYPEYKSTRTKLDEAMQADFDLALEQVRDLLAAFRVRVVARDGYEADDVIGTLAGQAAAAGLQVVIVSGDKDLYQLIGPRVALLNPGRGGPAGVEEQWVDASNADERLGVSPAQVVDFLALVGDSSDNIPGVRGIGEKGAAKLLAEFGDLDTLLARAADVSQKRSREALLAHAAEARLSRELVTIQRDVPVELELEAFAVAEPDRDALIEVLSRLEFHSLLTRLVPAETDAPPVADAGDAPAVAGDGAGVRVLAAVDDLPAMVAALRAAPRVALRAWVDGPEPREWRLVGLGLAGTGPGSWYLPFAHEPRDGPLAGEDPPANLPAPADLDALRALLEDDTVTVVAHDLKAEWEALRGAGLKLAGPGDDVMLASFALDPGRRSHALDTLVPDQLGQALRSRSEVLGKGRGALAPVVVPVGEAAAQVGLELEAVLALWDRLGPALVDTELERLYRTIELPLVRVLLDMEWVGIAIDHAVFRTLARDLARDVEDLERRIGTAADEQVNLNSPRQLATLLFDRLGLPVLKKTKTGPSTDAEVLEQLAAMGHEIPRLILEHRELQKLRSTYVDVLPGRVSEHTGRIHTSFNQTGAATGRLSSSEPNLQNIPVRTARGEAIRRGFVPGEGWRFVVADYSQIELRLLAHFSGDAAFVRAFEEGGDIHRQTAAIIFGVEASAVTAEMRAQAKTINFATIYGQGPFALSRQLGIGQDEAKAFITQYFERFAGVRAWLDGQVALARSQGWVETLFGRRRYVPEVKDRNYNTRAFGERLAQNSPLQGSAADLIKIAMIRIHTALRDEGLAGRLLLQVHDELVLEAPPAEVEPVTALVRRHMESAAELRVPLVVEVGVGPNWLDAKG